MNPVFSIIIPVFNEEKNLPELLERTIAVCRSQAEQPFELIMVDDGSSDRSLNILQNAAQDIAELTVIPIKNNGGQHAAIFAGMVQSSGNIIITLDADLQNPPEEIPKILAAIRNVDMVGTVRCDRQDSFFRRKASSCVNALVCGIIYKRTGVMMHDYGCMLRGYRRSVVEEMLAYRDHSVFIPILANCFAKSVCEIEVRHNERKNGESKYTFCKLIRLQCALLLSVFRLLYVFHIKDNSRSSAL